MIDEFVEISRNSRKITSVSMRWAAILTEDFAPVPQLVSCNMWPPGWCKTLITLAVVFIKLSVKLNFSSKFNFASAAAFYNESEIFNLKESVDVPRRSGTSHLVRIGEVRWTRVLLSWQPRVCVGKVIRGKTNRVCWDFLLPPLLERRPGDFETTTDRTKNDEIFYLVKNIV